MKEGGRGRRDCGWQLEKLKAKESVTEACQTNRSQRRVKRVGHRGVSGLVKLDKGVIRVQTSGCRVLIDKGDIRVRGTDCGLAMQNKGFKNLRPQAHLNALGCGMQALCSALSSIWVADSHGRYDLLRRHAANHV